MSATPTDLDLHRSRTTVMTVHSNDETMMVDETWGTFDAGYSRSRAVKIPPLPRFAEGVVHALALYLAESKHARDHADAVSDLLVLDGPLYPRGLLRWADQHPDLADFLLEDPRPTTVLENYVRLVEDFVERDVPLVGFVKNPATRVLTRTLKSKRDVDISVPGATTRRCSPACSSAASTSTTSTASAGSGIRRRSRIRTGSARGAASIDRCRPRATRSASSVASTARPTRSRSS